MAYHSSSIKWLRQINSRRLHNRYYARTTRNAVRKLRELPDRKEAEELLKKVSGMLDKLAKRNVIHKNKASNLKSKLTLKINKLA